MRRRCWGKSNKGAKGGGMFIRFFVEAREKEEAIQIIQDNLKYEERMVSKVILNKIEPYWKIQGVYIAEVELKIQQELLGDFLDFFSDVWIEFGEPVEELLAYRDNKECKFMREKFVLIDVFLDKAGNMEFGFGNRGGEKR